MQPDQVTFFSPDFDSTLSFRLAPIVPEAVCANAALVSGLSADLFLPIWQSSETLAAQAVRPSFVYVFPDCVRFRFAFNPFLQSEKFSTPE